MQQVLNLTQHAATTEQVAAGVVDLPADERATLSEWLTFATLPTGQEVADRAALIAQAAAGDSITVASVPAGQYQYAMIGGAPYLMSALENALIKSGITPLYAFSVRESVEKTLPDGTVVKTNTFAHKGWVQM